MILELLTFAAISLTNQSCAAINNKTNKIVWGSPKHDLVSASYKDRGDVLEYTSPLPNLPDEEGMWDAIEHVHEAVAAGKPGNKIIVYCTS